MAVKPEYEWHAAALAGENPAIHEDQPQCGFFSYKDKAGNVVPAAIWVTDDGKMDASVGFSEGRLVDPNKLWLWVAKSPIRADAYWAAYDAGAWPGEPPKPAVPVRKEAAEIGDNSRKLGIEAVGADEAAVRIEAENLIDFCEGLRNKAKEFVAADKDGADAFANARARLSQVTRLIVSSRDAETAPLRTRIADINTKWASLIQQLGDFDSKLKEAVRAYLRAAEKKAAEEAAAAAAAAQAAREEALARAAAANAPPPEEADLPPAPPPPERVLVGGNVGRATGLRTQREAVIEDWDALWQAIRDRDDVKEFLQKIANQAARAKNPFPGTKVKETR